MDDLFLCNSSELILQEQASFTLKFLSSLGFTPNLEKSSFCPSRRISHLGFLWDTTAYSISLPESKVIKTKKLRQ